MLIIQNSYFLNAKLRRGFAENRGDKMFFFTELCEKSLRFSALKLSQNKIKVIY
jgi:hypothetical protein